MSRQAGKLRPELAQVVACELIGGELDKASEDFLTVLHAAAGNLSKEQYGDLEDAFNWAISQTIDAAFLAGVGVGRDPFSLILKPVSDDEGGDL